MKLEFLKLMKCPYCESHLEPEDICEGKEGEAATGFVFWPAYSILTCSGLRANTECDPQTPSRKDLLEA